MKRRASCKAGDFKYLPRQPVQLPLVFNQKLVETEIRNSMDDRGRQMNNVFIERLWRSMRCECVYLRTFKAGSALRAGLLRWVTHYNVHRSHSALARPTPNGAYSEIRRNASLRGDR